MAEILGNKYIKLYPFDNQENEMANNFFIGKDMSDNQAVFIKTLDIGKSGDEESSIREELFNREYYSLQRLSHKSIIKLIDAGQDKEFWYLITEYKHASTLKDFIAKSDLSIEEKLGICFQIADGLGYAHEMGIVHRDLKPRNILVEDAKSIKIIDFGISKIIGHSYNSDKTVRNYMTSRYASPEQLMMYDTTKSVDAYSLGLVIAFVLSGVEPPDKKNAIGEYIKTNIQNEDLRILISQLVRENVDTRLSSMAEIKKRIEIEINKINSKKFNLYISFTNYIQTSLFNFAMIEYQNNEHTKKFIKNDLVESHVYKDVRSNEFIVIGKAIKYTCKSSNSRKSLMITKVGYIDSFLDWEKETEKGIVVQIPWTPIILENECSDNNYLPYLYDDIINRTREKEIGKKRYSLRNQMLEKWNKLLQEEYNYLDERKKVCKYTNFEIDNSGYRLMVEVDNMSVELKNGDILQLTAQDGKQVTVGEFEDVDDDRLIIKLEKEVNPSMLSARGNIGIDIEKSKSNLKKYSRALQAIKLERTVNPNLADIISDPSFLEMNKSISLNSDEFCQEILKNNPDSSNADAIRKALGVKDIVLIQGPPGTGKSTVITELICQIMNRESKSKILLVSQSHVAVDHVVNKVSALISDKIIVRIGRAEKISNDTKNLILSEQITKWVDGVQKKSIIGLNECVLNIKDKESDIEKQDELAKRVDRINEIGENWRKRLGKLDEFDEIFADKASIIASTCLGIASRNLLNDTDFDWVIVDEAARATPLELLVPIVRGQKIVLVGDHRQLPPVVNTNINKIKLEEKGITSSDLEKSLFEDLYDKMSDQTKIILSNQYRMHPDISRLIGDVFYPSINITSPILAGDRNHNLSFWPKCIQWIDTSKHRDCDESDSALSKKNSAEAKVILKKLEEIENVYRRHKLINQTVAVISGYNAQKNLLNSLIKPNDANKWSALKIIIDNVDAFQGSESDIVIFSVVRSNKSNKIGFLSDERRLNVALSRGRNLLIIVGNYEFAKNARSFRGNPYSDVIRFMSQNKKSSFIEVHNENK